MSYKTLVVLLVLAGSLVFMGAKRPQARPGKLSLDDTIASYEEKIRLDPEKTQNYIVLAEMYLQKVRETADVAYYKTVESLVDQALRREPNNPDVFAVRATVALGRHNFKDALELGNKAITLKPERASYYGIVGDAHIERGEYEKARQAFENMLQRRPDFSSYTRVAYIRELHGDIDGAKDAFNRALEAGSLFPENLAWANVELGKLLYRTEPELARPYFEKALALVSDYPPALEGLGKISGALGEHEKALEYFLRASAQLPIAQYSIAIGDVYSAMGEKQKALQQYTIAKISFEHSYSSGVNTDMEYALFLAEHDLDLPQALEKARRAYEERKSIHGADTLAWALYKNGKFADAGRYAKEALRLGESDPGILVHAGMIAYKNGNRAEAKRLLEKSRTINSYFSPLLRVEAETVLKTL